MNDKEILNLLQSIENKINNAKIEYKLKKRLKDHQFRNLVYDFKKNKKIHTNDIKENIIPPNFTLIEFENKT